MYFHSVTVDIHSESESRDKMNESGTPEPEDFVLEMPISGITGSSHQEQITRFMKLYMPGIQFLDERGSELRYLMPLNQPHLLAQLFDQLDYNLTALGMTSYGLSACSMEQVFVSLNEERGDVNTNGEQLLLCIVCIIHTVGIEFPSHVCARVLCSQ